MKKRYQVYFFFIGAGIFLLITVPIILNKIKREYLIIFKANGFVANNNDGGKLEGRVDYYTNGKISKQITFKNGMLDGPAVEYYSTGKLLEKSFFKDNKIDSMQFLYDTNGHLKKAAKFKNGMLNGNLTTYYSNGNIENKKSYVNNQLNGAEFEYFENNTLKYNGNWINNKPYGDLYFFYPNKKIDFYHTYDILGEKFYLSRYDLSGKVIRTEGSSFSNNVYSRDEYTDSIIILKDKGHYDAIKDLYITVTNPPDITNQIQVIVNNKPWKKLIFINKNTLKLTNIFNRPSLFDIEVYSRLIDKSNKIIKGFSSEVSIVKDE